MADDPNEIGPDALVTASRRRRRTFVRRAISSVSPTASVGYASFEGAYGRGFLPNPFECFRFVQGATTWRHTSSDRSQTITDGTYTPVVIQRGAIDFSQEDTAENVEVRVQDSHPVAALFVAYNPATPVYLTIIRKHRNDAEETVIFVGKVVRVDFDGPEAKMACAPISGVFRRRVPSLVYQSHCNWPLYGAGCGVNSATFTDSGTVLAVSGSTVRAAVFATRADGWFTNGWAQIAGSQMRFITNHVGDTITLQTPFSSLAVGAAIDARAGCDRTEATCAGKFSNLVNHSGFPRIPNRNPYGSSLI